MWEHHFYLKDGVSRPDFLGWVKSVLAEEDRRLMAFQELFYREPRVGEFSFLKGVTEGLLSLTAKQKFMAFPGVNVVVLNIPYKEP